MTVTYPAYRGLRLEEDFGLETLLSGIVLPDARGLPVPVPVRFREPTREKAPATPPYIIIDPLGTRRDPEREHRGWSVPFTFEPYTNNFLPDKGAIGEFPIPIILTYQIMTVTRNNQHDVILTDMLISTQLPFRFGSLTCPSGTVRRLDIISGPSDQSRLAGDRREFRKVWTIEVSAEIVPPQTPIVTPAEIVITVEDTETGVIDATLTKTA